MCLKISFIFFLSSDVCSAVVKRGSVEATAVRPAHTCVSLCVAKCYVCMLLHNVQQHS